MVPYNTRAAYNGSKMRNHFQNTQKTVPTNYLKYIWDLPTSVPMHIVHLHLKMCIQVYGTGWGFINDFEKKNRVSVQYVIFFDFLSKQKKVHRKKFCMQIPALPIRWARQRNNEGTKCKWCYNICRIEKVVKLARNCHFPVLNNLLWWGWAEASNEHPKIECSNK